MFEIRQRGSTVGREILGGVTTFMAMSYIIFVQFGLLGKVAGMDPGGVMAATCIAAGAASILMGLLANYPIALAPGMGENFYFVYTMIGVAGGGMAAWGVGVPWQMALALTVLAGAIFLLLSMVSFRSRVLDAVPDALKSGIAAGIGLFIAVIGFSYGNLVVQAAPGGLVDLPDLRNNPIGWIALTGLGVTMVLVAYRVHGAILLGILTSTAVALVCGLTQWRFPLALPSGLATTAGAFVPGMRDLWSALPDHWIEILTMLFVLLFMDLFDTIGTLVGVSQRAGLIRDGRLPRAERALFADATGTVIGGCLGTSTVTSYIESITGVEAGARTGLAAVAAGACMLGAVFFRPLVEMVMGNFVVDVTAPGGAVLASVRKFPTIAPALILVGAMMLRTMRDVDWDDVTEYLPAFLTMITIPLAYSISDGIAMGFVSYALGKLATGRAKQCPMLVYVFAVLFVIRYAIAGQA